MKIIGDKSVIGFELGNQVDCSQEFRHLDIWIADELVTLHDNIAYIPATISAAKEDIERKREISRFESYFEGLDVTSIHEFILKTRITESHEAPSDQDLFHEHQVFDWGPITDQVFSFLIPPMAVFT